MPIGCVYVFLFLPKVLNKKSFLNINIILNYKGYCSNKTHNRCLHFDLSAKQLFRKSEHQCSVSALKPLLYHSILWARQSFFSPRWLPLHVMSEEAVTGTACTQWPFILRPTPNIHPVNSHLSYSSSTHIRHKQSHVQFALRMICLDCTWAVASCPKPPKKPV